MKTQKDVIKILREHAIRRSEAIQKQPLLTKNDWGRIANRCRRDQEPADPGRSFLRTLRLQYRQFTAPTWSKFCTVCLVVAAGSLLSFGWLLLVGHISLSKLEQSQAHVEIPNSNQEGQYTVKEDLRSLQILLVEFAVYSKDNSRITDQVAKMATKMRPAAHSSPEQIQKEQQLERRLKDRVFELRDRLVKGGALTPDLEKDIGMLLRQIDKRGVYVE